MKIDFELATKDEHGHTLANTTTNTIDEVINLLKYAKKQKYGYINFYIDGEYSCGYKLDI